MRKDNGTVKQQRQIHYLNATILKNPLALDSRLNLARQFDRIELLNDPRQSRPDHRLTPRKMRVSF